MRSALIELKFASCTQTLSDGVANAPHRLYELTIVLAVYFASQQSNECIESVLFNLVIKVPNSLHDRVSGHDASRSPHE